MAWRQRSDKLLFKSATCGRVDRKVCGDFISSDATRFIAECDSAIFKLQIKEELQDNLE